MHFCEEDLMRIKFWRQCAGHDSDLDREIEAKIDVLLEELRIRQPGQVAKQGYLAWQLTDHRPMTGKAVVS